MFETYERIDNEIVKAASADSILVGKGIVTLPIEGGIKFEAFHAPQFGSNIISVGLLSRLYEILFSNSIRLYPGCFLLRPKTLEVAAEYPMKDMLYPIPMKNSTMSNVALNSRAESILSKALMRRRKV